MTLSNAGSRTRKGERCAGENVKCQYSIVRSWNICFQNIWDQKEGGGATLETKICSWYMVRNTFINYDSEIGFSPRIFVIRFLPPGTNYYYYFFFLKAYCLVLYFFTPFSWYQQQQPPFWRCGFLGCCFNTFFILLIYIRPLKFTFVLSFSRNRW